MHGMADNFRGLGANLKQSLSLLMPSKQPYSGLTPAQVAAARAAHGQNKLQSHEPPMAWVWAKALFADPMTLLLLGTAGVYLALGKQTDAIFMVVAVTIVSGISLYQNARTHTAIAALKELTKPKAQVIRQRKASYIPTEDLVVGDVLLITEGSPVPADATLLKAYDFSVSEAVLTGESLPVTKATKEPIFQGTTALTGQGYARVTAVGNQTKLGQIGKSLAAIKPADTPLQKQIRAFVGKMMLAGGIVFCLVWGGNYYLQRDILQSLLKALALAMSVVPEEIPVAFATFMALGAYRLMKAGVLVKQTVTIETLGSATVICTDKTGTLTENKMALARVYALGAQAQEQDMGALSEAGQKVLTLAMWASEPTPYDPMELALHKAYQSFTPQDLRSDYILHYEYPLGGTPPMMTHIFTSKNGTQIIAAKGAPEAILAVSKLEFKQKEGLLAQAKALAGEGFRVLAVAETTWPAEPYPKKQQDFAFTCLGLVAFYDPPKKNLATVLNKLYKAGIQVKIITGDMGTTAATLAKEVGFAGADAMLEADQLANLTNAQLQDTVHTTQIFARMYPEAKLRVINALQARGDVVAMLGDGVNDGPALKAATIGIAMGKRGSELAKQAAAMVLLHDNFTAIVTGVALGRRIYSNLKKAIQYLVSIHIPIILTVLVPLALGARHSTVFYPIHIIFLELIMGPTCSIIFENEPPERNLMAQKPRPVTDTFFTWLELRNSLLQGLVISAGTLGVYFWAVAQQFTENQTRTLVFMTLLAANICLTFVNRSSTEPVWATLFRPNKLLRGITILTTGLAVAIYQVPYLRTLFELERVPLAAMALAMGCSLCVTLWYDIVKLWRGRR